MLYVNNRQAYSEIDSFIELLDDYNKNKIPKKLRDFFKKEKDNNYIKKIDANIPIKYQNLKEESLAILAILNLKYWCEDENEKKRLREIYYNNEIKYQEKLKEKYNKDNLFKNKPETTVKSQISETAMIKYKEENLFQKIKKIIRKLINFK